MEAEANQRARIKIIQESRRSQATSGGPLPLVGFQGERILFLWVAFCSCFGPIMESSLGGRHGQQTERELVEKSYP